MTQIVARIHKTTIWKLKWDQTLITVCDFGLNEETTLMSDQLFVFYYFHNSRYIVTGPDVLIVKHESNMEQNNFKDTKLHSF